jgi:DNA-binding NarL/FixJ family response regulator
VGYLLKDRVADVSEFVDAITRMAGGGTVLDPEVVRHLLRASRRADALAVLTPREREVLTLMAQGRSNTAIASEFTISPRVVERHVASIFAKLGLEPSGHDDRRVLATIKYLESRPVRGQFHPVHTMRLASRADQPVRRAPARRVPARDRSAVGS